MKRILSLALLLLLPAASQAAPAKATFTRNHVVSLTGPRDFNNTWYKTRIKANTESLYRLDTNSARKLLGKVQEVADRFYHPGEIKTFVETKLKDMHEGMTTRDKNYPHFVRTGSYGDKGTIITSIGPRLGKKMTLIVDKNLVKYNERDWQSGRSAVDAWARVDGTKLATILTRNDHAEDRDLLSQAKYIRFESKNNVGSAAYHSGSVRLYDMYFRPLTKEGSELPMFSYRNYKSFSELASEATPN